MQLINFIPEYNIIPDLCETVNSFTFVSDIYKEPKFQNDLVTRFKMVTIKLDLCAFY